MKKCYLTMLFLVFFASLLFGDNDKPEEIDFLLFSPNSSSIFADEEQAKSRLDNAAKYLEGRKLRPGQIQIHGYAAAAKNEVEALTLSRDRAFIVMNELQERGIRPYLFSEPTGHGEVDIWGSNLTEEDKNPNRRVRIVLDVYRPAGAVLAGGIRHRAFYAERESRLEFPWLIFILLLLATAVLAALILFAAKIRKDAGRRTGSNSIENNKPIAGGGKARFVDTAPMTFTEDSFVNDSTNGNWKNSSGTGRSKFMELEKAIREIIGGIPAGAHFDVHTVVEKLLQEHDETYLMSVGNYTSAAQYHSKISAIIAHEVELVEKVGDSYSKNIHDKFSECHLFRRKK
ncbi:MAG: OmpA family protein [Treponema sp.]|nr:OmpA family protein [Treponema sp.]